MFKSVIETHEGKIIETAGDGLYAVFGLNSGIKKACSSSVAAGLAIIEQLEIFNKNYLKLYFDKQFDIGMGLHRGEVIVGNVGLGITDTTVMGLAVNIAARLQSATKKLNNNFIVSDDVIQLLDKPIQSTTKEISLKGVHEPQLVHLVGRIYN
jgi:adenylate cyclase